MIGLRTVKIAILDLYEGQENQGMRCIRQIIKDWAQKNNIKVSCDEFEVRIKNQVPGTGYDLYISSGGPGSPLDTIDTKWEAQYFRWLKSIEDWNSNDDQPKKYVFFICHSFQLAARHYQVGQVCKRRSTSFGTFPVHMAEVAAGEPVFDGLSDPFYAVDSRDYQVISPNLARLDELGGCLLALEKDRPHVPFERAIMAIRFNPYFIGTQFHPEADATGMSMYLQREDKKATVIQNHGEAKWRTMIDHLNDPDKIMLTYSKILPNFLNLAIEQPVPAAV